MRFIKNWKELSEEKSETHELEIDLAHGCGWITNKTDKEDDYYLTTHTFYGSMHKECTKVLQSKGFAVVLANWDAK